VGTWPPVLNIFKTALNSGKFAEDLKMATGDSWKIEKVRCRGPVCHPSPQVMRP
jgi:hypothetical protein